MNMKLHVLIGGAVLAVLAGCGPNKGQQAQAPRGDRPPEGAEVLPAKEPAITADTRFAAGQVAETQGNLQNAVDQYEQALKADPKHKATLYRLAVLRARLKQHNEAIALWQRYLKVTNGDAAGYANLGFCYELANRPVEAEKAYKTGVAKDPRNGPVRVNYGLMLARFGHVEEAVAQWREVLSEAEVRYNLGSVYELQGKKGEAREQYILALKHNPSMSDAKTRLANLK